MFDPRTYPQSANPVSSITVSGATGTVDLSKHNVILMTNTNATAITVSKPVPGMFYYLEQSATGVNNHAVTFSGVTINATGNNVATTNARDESLVLLALSTTRMAIIANNGAVALS